MVEAPRIIRTLDADRDLDSLFDWIAYDSGFERAEAVIRRIDETITHVAAMPGVGRIRKDLDGAPRSFSVWPWLVIYETLPRREGIVVWRVLDGRRDLPAVVKRPR
jgi:plasmid stabilization system protein ParE